MKNTSQMVDEPSSFVPPSSCNANAAPTMRSKSMSSAALDAAIEYEIKMGTIDPNMDRKNMRRLISNRYASKKAHNRKVNEIVELENKQKQLENTVATLQPMIEYEKHVQSRLRLENAMLVQQLQIRSDVSKLKEAETASNKMEIELLKEFVQKHQSPYNFDIGPSGL